jgi:NAD-dependent SIR2 family protein deacetylase
MRMFYVARRFSRRPRAEHFDSEADIAAACERVAGRLSAARHAIAFCGAGLSTASGIPDYRSGYQTVLPTGPGKWETDENKAKFGRTPLRKRPDETWPNKGHLALSALVRAGLIKFVISQNVDGLLQRAGINEAAVSELHGNVFTEHCAACSKTYWRDFPIPNWQTKVHETGRHCDCERGQPLRDSLIYFGDSLSKRELDACHGQLAHADFCMVLGSSLQVQPASGFVRHFLKSGLPNSLAIVNLQKTDYHDKGAIEVHDFCDSFLLRLVDRLGLTLPAPQLDRHLHLLPKEEGYELGFVDEQGRLVQASHGFTLLSVTGQSKSLAHWPFRVSEQDLEVYTTVQYTLIADKSSHEVSLSSLLSDARRHTLEYNPQTWTR